MARSEGSIMNKIFRQWHSIYDASWYAFGTLLGEAFNVEMQLGKSRALRIIVGIWILYCLIMSQSYAGNLKAYLTTPAYSEPIDTLEQV